ncbi:MAG: hypothetical protein AB1499_00695 [Nitrospirota bacterium]
MSTFNFNRFVVFILLVIFSMIIPGVSISEALDNSKFYTLSPSENSSGLWSIDPSTGATSLVTPITLPDGSTPNFMTNALAFSPNNELYGWDTARKQLYNINYTTGQINYIGSQGTDAAPQFVNGLAFDKQGTLYGLVGGNINQGAAPSTLYSINTSTGALSPVGNSYVNTSHNSLAVDFESGGLLSITGGTNSPNYLLQVNPDAQPVLNDTFSSNTSGNYSWSTSGSGTGYSWNSAGYITMDGYGGAWVPASVTARGNIDMPSSGYAKIDFNISTNGDGQSRLIFSLLEDADNYFKFVLTDTTYGSSGYTQRAEKTVNGVSEFTSMAGSLNTGSYSWEMWWNPTNLRMDLNGTTVQNIATADATIIDPVLFDFTVYRFIGNWDSVKVDPGIAEIIDELGIRYNGIGSEFDPGTGKLYAVRDNNVLYSININTGEETEIGILGNGVSTVNLAHPWPQTPVVPEPISIVLFISGGAVLGIRSLRTKNQL